MNSKFMMYLAYAFIAGTLICLVIEGSAWGASHSTVLNSLKVFKVANILGIWQLPTVNVEFFTVGVPKLLLWDYSFLTGGWLYFKLFLYILSIGAIWGFIEVVLSLIQYAVRR